MSISRTLIGLGVAASLFLGCQQLAGRDDAPGGNPDGAADAGTVPDPGPLLRVKPTEECLALHRLVLAADSAGDSTITLRTDFVRRCLEEVKAGPGRDIPVPPDQVPGKPSSCEWALAKLDTLDTASEEHSKLKHFLHHHCGAIRPPKDTLTPPHHPPKDTLTPHHPPKDTLMPPPHPPKDTLDTLPPPPPQPSLCDSLRKQLASLDPLSAQYGVLKQKLHDACPPPDPVLPPPPPTPATCDSWRALLAGMDPVRDSAKYAGFKTYIDSVCPAKPALPPAPPVPPVCDSLRKALSLLDPVGDPLTYGLAKQKMTEACPSPEPVLPPPATPAMCASWRAQLAAMEPVRDTKYASFKSYIDSQCQAFP